MSGWSWFFVAWVGITAAFLFIYGGASSLVHAAGILLGLLAFTAIFKET